MKETDWTTVIIFGIWAAMIVAMIWIVAVYAS